MKMRLLDCTLREAPVKNFKIGSRLIREFVCGCEKVGIDIIEVGFLKNTDNGADSNCFATVEEIRKFIPHKRADICYVALMDHGRFDIKNLSPYDDTSIDGIRICFKYGEQRAAIEDAYAIKAKGYKVFIQHVDTLAYSDIEIIEFLKLVNELVPTGYAIVDTFGSMYADDLDRLSMLIDHHLNDNIILGFHAHNNLMLANSNAQNFIFRHAGKRDIIVDSSILGCGRGAGNAHTELLAEFLNKKYHYDYDLDALLDMIDYLVPQFRERCRWGYSIPYFLSGVHGTHIYNANHLLKRHNLPSKDLRAIIDALDERQKKRYDYTLLERLYVEHFDHTVDDSAVRQELKTALSQKKILLVAPGKSLILEREKIKLFIDKESPIIIGVNFVPQDLVINYVFFSNDKRFQKYKDDCCVNNIGVIVTSNLIISPDKKNVKVIDYKSLVKFGWINLDSAMILLLRFLCRLDCLEVYMVGFDGFTKNQIDNYYLDVLPTDVNEEDLLILTKENQEMLNDIKKSYPILKIHFVTNSRYTFNN